MARIALQLIVKLENRLIKSFPLLRVWREKQKGRRKGKNLPPPFFISLSLSLSVCLSVGVGMSMAFAVGVRMSMGKGRSVFRNQTPCEIFLIYCQLRFSSFYFTVYCVHTRIHRSRRYSKD